SGVRRFFRIFEFTLLERPSLDIEPGLQKNRIRFLDHEALQGPAVSNGPAQDYRDVRVAPRLVVASRTAAKQNELQIIAPEPPAKLAVELAQRCSYDGIPDR